MKRNETAADDSKTGGFPKVQDNKAMKEFVPYYWSWYGCIFSPGILPPGKIPAVMVEEKT